MHFILHQFLYHDAVMTADKFPISEIQLMIMYKTNQQSPEIQAVRFLPHGDHLSSNKRRCSIDGQCYQMSVESITEDEFGHKINTLNLIVWLITELSDTLN